jgi:His/Glu/Gln/Arg/opine family amino acid ABC transporter permease subunit
MTYFSPAYFLIMLPKVAAKIPLTLGMAAAGFAGAVVLALALALVQVYRVPLARQIAVVYISFIRGTPILVQLLICGIFLPALIGEITGVNVGRIWPPLVFIIAALALNTAAFLGEVLRSAINGVDRGQIDAARSVGMAEWQTLRSVVLPQAFRIALPNIQTIFIGTLKDTSYAHGAGGALDVIGIVAVSTARSFRALEGYSAAAIVFLVLCISLEFVFSFIAKRLSRGDLSINAKTKTASAPSNAGSGP